MLTPHIYFNNADLCVGDRLVRLMCDKAYVETCVETYVEVTYSFEGPALWIPQLWIHMVAT